MSGIGSMHGLFAYGPGAVGAGFPDVPWSPMARVRDRAAHHHYTLDRDVVWDTARAAVPGAGAAIRAALGALGRPWT